MAIIVKCSIAVHMIGLDILKEQLLCRIRIGFVLQIVRFLTLLPQGGLTKCDSQTVLYLIKHQLVYSTNI